MLKGHFVSLNFLENKVDENKNEWSLQLKKLKKGPKRNLSEAKEGSKKDRGRN